MIIDTLSLDFVTAPLRMPFKFGAAVMTSLTVPTVRVSLEHNGQKSWGIGAMPMGNAWSFPGVPYEKSLEAMQEIVQAIAAAISNIEIPDDPLEASFALQDLALAEAGKISEKLFGDTTTIPKLCTLVCFSAFDIAFFDAWGALHNRNTFELLREQTTDLSRWLGPDYHGFTIADAIPSSPADKLSIFHVVGGLDPLTPDEIKKPVGDGLPEDLLSWIERDKLTHFKIKMTGVDPEGDYQRIRAVDRTCLEPVRKQHGHDPVYSLDMNEQTPSGTMLLEILRRFQREEPEVLARIEFLEQPTKRDFTGGREDGLPDVNKILPVVIDEGLVDLESLNRALELGYNGICLKACKGIGFSLLAAAVAKKQNLYLCVQDLTCPGISFVASSTLAAWSGVSGLEANARQYCPDANAEGLIKMPAVFKLDGGAIQPGQSASDNGNVLAGTGLNTRTLL